MANVVFYALVLCIMLVGLVLVHYPWRSNDLRAFGLRTPLTFLLGISITTPVGEILQEVKLGPLWLRHHLTDVGSVVVWAVLPACASLGVSYLIWRRPPALRAVCTVLAVSQIATFGGGAMYEWQQYQVKLMAGHTASYDWGDVGAYGLGTAGLLISLRMLYDRLSKCSLEWES